MNTSKRGFEVRALGEIAIRCNCFDQMAEFYENIIGLKRLKGNHSEGIFFLESQMGSLAIQRFSRSLMLNSAGMLGVLPRTYQLLPATHHRYIILLFQYRIRNKMLQYLGTRKTILSIK